MLSGGQRRRLDVALGHRRPSRAALPRRAHRPGSTPRRDASSTAWSARSRASSETTILITTHDLDEAREARRPHHHPRRRADHRRRHLRANSHDRSSATDEVRWVHDGQRHARSAAESTAFVRELFTGRLARRSASSTVRRAIAGGDVPDAGAPRRSSPPPLRPAPSRTGGGLPMTPAATTLARAGCRAACIELRQAFSGSEHWSDSCSGRSPRSWPMFFLARPEWWARGAFTLGSRDAAGRARHVRGARACSSVDAAARRRSRGRHPAAGEGDPERDSRPTSSASSSQMLGDGARCTWRSS